MSLLCFIWGEHGDISLRRESPAFIRDFPSGFERDLRLRPPPGLPAEAKATGAIPFFLCRHIAQCSEAKCAGAEALGPSPHPISVVKSSLQKAVRRGLQRAALSATAHLLAREPKELLRRLPIVFVEDVGIVSDLPKLMWLSVAVQSGYELSEDDVYFILALVAAATLHSQRTVPPVFGARNEDVRIAAVVSRLLNPSGTGNPDGKVAETGETTDPSAAESMEDERIHSIVTCLVLRACYGGMSGDIDMLLSLAARPDTWTGCIMRAVSSSRCFCPGDEESHVHAWLLKLLSLRAHWSGRLPLEDQLDVAVDFHCSDIAPKWYAYLRSRGSSVPFQPPSSEQEVKDAMWTHRSSLNFRTQSRTALPSWWDPSAEAELSRLSRAVWTDRAAPAATASSAKRPPQMETERAGAKKQRATTSAGTGRQLSIFRFAAASSAGAAGA